MSSDKRKKVQISNSYRWAAPDLQQLVQFTRGPHTDFLGEGFQFRARIEQSGPPKT